MAEFKNAGPLQSKASKPLEGFFRRHLAGARLIYDHGCGFGGWTNYISTLIGARAAIYDPDQAGCAHARELLGERFVESDGPFDAIMCFGVLELLEPDDQVKLLREFAQKLQGPLLVQYNVYNPLAPRWLAVRVMRGNPIAWHERNRFHRTYLSRNRVEQLFRDGGFEIVEKCHPSLENHLSRRVNDLLGPLVPSRFHMTFYYALEKR